MADRAAARRDLAAAAAMFHDLLAAEALSGVAWLPWEGPSPAALAAPGAAEAIHPAAAPAATDPAPTAPPPPPPRPAAPGTLPRAARERALSAVAAEVAACTACRLAAGRTCTVPGEGDPEARVLFVGEGPGEQEDLSGRPFVGRAGQLLRQLITEELGLDPSAVFIANIVKCRPPGNRAPEPDEAAACLPFLRRQVAAIRPRVIVTLGNPSTQSLLQTKEGITKLRGRPVERSGFTFFPTFHPSYLLRNRAEIETGRRDFREIRRLLEG